MFVACWCARAMVESTDNDQSTMPAASAAANLKCDQPRAVAPPMIVGTKWEESNDRKRR